MTSRYHRTHKFINTGLDLVAFVQGALLLHPPDIIFLNDVDLLCKFHPLILGFGYMLFLVELANES